MQQVVIRRLGDADADVVIGAADLFDEPPTRTATERFFASHGHHLCMAFVGDRAVGFVSGVEMTHPDKGTELFVYELGVDEAHRRRGIATMLLGELEAIAGERGCVGMWVGTESDNVAANATYRSFGADGPTPSVVYDWRLDG